MRTRYTINVKLGDKDTLIHARTYNDIVNQVNTLVGYKVVSKIIVTNWLSRGRKSKKYNFITLL
jgi:hypothetical protein